LKFLRAFKGQPTTIISLGAGYDTTLFWLIDTEPELASHLTWVELDYDTVV